MTKAQQGFWFGNPLGWSCRFDALDVCLGFRVYHIQNPSEILSTTAWPKSKAATYDSQATGECRSRLSR